jgi:hypothetical protein
MKDESEKAKTGSDHGSRATLDAPSAVIRFILHPSAFIPLYAATRWLTGVLHGPTSPLVLVQRAK